MVSENNMQDLALRLAEKGYRIFPTRLKWDDEGNRKGAPRIYKVNGKPLSWQKNGTSDPDEVEELWDRFGDANSAFIDCEGSGVVVVDCDVKHGDPGVEQFCEAAGINPDWPADDPRAPYVLTPTGGRHYYFSANAEHPVKSVTGQFDTAVDTKSVGNPVFAYGEPPAVADLPPVPQVVWERCPHGKTKREMAAEQDGDEPATESKWDVDFDDTTRPFTKEQAWRDFIAPALEALAEAKTPNIQGTANTTAVVLSHFGDEFFDEDKPKVKAFLEALRQTDYDGPGSGKKRGKGSSVWTYHRFIPLLNGEEEVDDPWAAVLRAPKVSTEPGEDVSDDDLVSFYVKRKKAQKQADRIIADEEFSAHAIVLESASLEAMLANPDIVEAPFRVDRLHQIGYNTTITAQYKTGKSHVAANLARALADDVPFLDEFMVVRPAGNIGFLNYELTDSNMVTWFRHMDIENPKRIFPLNLRGKKFSLVSERYQEELIRWCRDSDIEVLIVDPHRRAFSGFGSENSNDDVNAFAEVLDNVKYEANVADLFLTVHTGRGQQEEGDEHARGATALDDWVDQRWVITKKDNDRYMYAQGRLGDVREFKLGFDAETHRMWWEEGDRRTGSVDKYKDPLFRLIRDSGERGLNKGEMQTKMTAQGFKFAEGGRKNELAPAIDELVADGSIEGRKKGTEKRYWLTENCPPVDGTYKAL